MSCDVGEATSQLILQPFRRLTYVTAHSQTLLSLLLRHRLFTYVTWRAAHGRQQRYHPATAYCLKEHSEVSVPIAKSNYQLISSTSLLPCRICNRFPVPTKIEFQWRCYQTTAISIIATVCTAMRCFMILLRAIYRSIFRQFMKSSEKSSVWREIWQNFWSWWSAWDLNGFHSFIAWDSSVSINCFVCSVIVRFFIIF